MNRPTAPQPPAKQPTPQPAAAQPKDKGFRGSKSTTLKDWAGVLGLTALLTAGGATLGYSLPDTPEPVTVTTQTQAPALMISDPGDVLSPEDEARLEKDAERLQHPDTVKTLHYLTLNEGRDNVNDSVENYLRDNHPDQIGNDYFADGVLIVGTDVEGRNNFIFAGQDVLDQLYLRSGQRLEGALEAMKPGLRDNNIPGGYFAGANAAMDIEAAQNYPVEDASSDKTVGAVVGGLLAGVAGFSTGSIAISRRKKRREAIAQARTDHSLIAAEYTGLSQRLDELDIRANSVSSAFANIELRKQWEEVRDRFLGMHDAMQLEVGTDRQAWENHKQLAEFAATVEDTGNAEENINRLFAVERGDAAQRRSIITEIRADVIQARRKIKNKELKRDLAEVERGLDYLIQNPEYPGFIDQLTRLLGDYSLILDDIKRREFSDVKEYNKLEQPRITDPGFIYTNYVPYVTLNSWHTSNVQAHQAAQASSSSGSANTSFSSGFSGGGGSSSY